jgi:ribosome-dependent ATPase
MSSPAWAARVSRVQLQYKKTIALKNVSLEIPAGELIGFIGPDGVGKSSLLSLIAGSRKIQSGSVETLGGNMADADHRRRVCSRIAYMPQGLGRNLYPSLSVFENADFFGRLFGLDANTRKQRIAELLQAVGLGEFPGRPAGALSGGMKQKLGLCCALIHDPDLLILDEPTTGVDPLSRRQFWELIAGIRTRRRDLTILVATAYFDEAENFDQLVVMSAGQVLAAGSPVQLKRQWEAASLEQVYARLLGGVAEDWSQVRVGNPESNQSALAIEAHGLTRRFGDFVAVDAIDLGIRKGEIFGFVGPNGCGKTTTMKMLTGLLPASSGTARLLGQPVDVRDLSLRSRVGFMSQSFSLYSELTVRQNLQLHAHLFHLTPQIASTRTSYLVERFGLGQYLDEGAEHLPLGVRQRLSLAVALIHEPELLILDEPTSGVDPMARDHFWHLLLELARDRGVTIFISTHFMNEAARCDRIALMFEGRILTTGAPADIIRDTGASSLEDAFIARLDQLAGATGSKPGAGGHIDARPALALSGSHERRRTGFTFSRLWTYSRREWMEIRRDPIRLAFALLGPIVLMIVFGYGITFDVERLSYASLDYDRTAESRSYLEGFSSSRYFTSHRDVKNAADLETRMRDGELRFVIEIPPGFGRDLKAGRSPEVAVWVDGAFPFRAETTRGYVEGVHEMYLGELTRHSSRAGQESTLPARVEARFRYNQDFRSVFAVVPGTMMMLLLFMPAIMTALGVVREKELGSMVNFHVTPTTKLEFLLGKQLPYVGVGLVNFVTLLALAVWLFGVPVKGSLVALTVGAVFYVISSTAFGLLISNFVKTQIAAIFATAIITTVPAIEYSGFITPVSSLSSDAQAIGGAFASTYFLHLGLGTFTKALGLSDVGWDLLALALIAVVVTLFARAALPAQES